MDSETIAENRIMLLKADPPKGYNYRQTYEWAQRLYNGDGDERGRRIYSDAGRMDAKYVMEVAHRAALGRALPTEAQWNHLRASIRRLTEELRGES